MDLTFKKNDLNELRATNDRSVTMNSFVCLYIEGKMVGDWHHANTGAPLLDPICTREETVSFYGWVAGHLSLSGSLGLRDILDVGDVH